MEDGPVEEVSAVWPVGPSHTPRTTTTTTNFETRYDLAPIPQLRGEINYDDWKEAVEVHAEWFELDGILDRTEVLAPTATAKEKQEFILG